MINFILLYNLHLLGLSETVFIIHPECEEMINLNAYLHGCAIFESIKNISDTHDKKYTKG